MKDNKNYVALYLSAIQYYSSIQRFPSLLSSTISFVYYHFSKHFLIHNNFCLLYNIFIDGWRVQMVHLDDQVVFKEVLKLRFLSTDNDLDFKIKVSNRFEKVVCN